MSPNIWKVVCILPLFFVSTTSTFLWPFNNPFFNPIGVANSSNPDKPLQTLENVGLDGPDGAPKNRLIPKTKYPGSWELFSQNSGVSAMHAIMLPKINKVLMYDATIWRISALKFPDGAPCHVVNAETNEIDCWAHSVLLDINTAALRPLQLNTDTWCSSGGLSENGTLVGTGGFQKGANTARYLLDCDTCDWVEYPNALAAPRWYSTQVTLPDGSFMVFGGRNATSYELIPPEGVINTKVFDSLLLQQTTDKDENNLYPFVYLSTDGNIFLFANDRSVLINPQTNTIVRSFPTLQGGARNYPASGMSVLLPIKLSVQNDPTISADVLVCGGAEKTAFELAGKGTFLDALRSCGRMTITDKHPQWKTEMMPSPRILGDSILLPTGQVLIINGAKKGSAGWHFAKDPNFVPVLYSPDGRLNGKFKELAPATIPRMYHSTSVLMPDGKVLIAGSNTNNGYIYDAEYPTELRVEKFSPPYLDPALAENKPQIVEGVTETMLVYGKQFKIQIRSKNVPDIGSLMVTMYAPPFTTHGISMNQRMLILGLVNVQNDVVEGVFNINAMAPPSGNVAPKGYYLLYVAYRGVPSTAIWVHVA